MVQIRAEASILVGASDFWSITTLTAINYYSPLVIELAKLNQIALSMYSTTVCAINRGY